jgi:peptidyl-dipeptidase Dcp
MIWVIRYCSNRDIRKLFSQVRSSFASEGKYDNRKNILDIITNRKDKANILWYDNYAQLSLEFKMADSEEEIINFIKNIWNKTKKKAFEEIDLLKKYFGLSDFWPYDIYYYSRIYKKKEFNFEESEFRNYFEFESVLAWLFGIVKDFYWVEVKEISPEKYNKDLKIYEIYKDDKLISYFIGDYFYRKWKDSWAWNNNLRNRFYSNKKDIKPIIVNVASFQKASSWKVLLDLRDVETIFHEFWHALHHILSENTYPDLGLSQIEWDFVELPSQLMENWCTDKDSLNRFAKHHETWELISDDFINTFNKLKTFWNGIMYSSYHHLEIFDLLVHGEDIPANIEEIAWLYKKIYEEYSIFNFDDSNKKYTSFDHVFAWWYAVWFYSYMWAEIIEADVFSRIKELWMFDREVWEKFINTILGQWTRKKATELFFDFMWREVDNIAFMERKGL